MQYIPKLSDPKISQSNILWQKKKKKSLPTKSGNEFAKFKILKQKKKIILTNYFIFL